MNKENIAYFHGGGDTIGGIETYLACQLSNHKKFDPHLLILKDGKYLQYLKSNNINNIYHLRGGRFREVPKFIKALYVGRNYIKDNNIKLIISHGLHSWIFGGLLSKICGIKSIFYLHGPVDNEVLKTLFGRIGFYIKPDIYVSNSFFTYESCKKYLNIEMPVFIPQVR